MPQDPSMDSSFPAGSSRGRKKQGRGRAGEGRAGTQAPHRQVGPRRSGFWRSDHSPGCPSARAEPPSPPALPGPSCGHCPLVWRPPALQPQPELLEAGARPRQEGAGAACAQHQPLKGCPLGRGASLAAPTMMGFVPLQPRCPVVPGLGWGWGCSGAGRRGRLQAPEGSPRPPPPGPSCGTSVPPPGPGTSA